MFTKFSSELVKDLVCEMDTAIMNLMDVENMLDAVPRAKALKDLFEKHELDRGLQYSFSDLCPNAQEALNLSEEEQDDSEDYSTRDIK
jgi:hypothetical protein